MQGGSIVLTTVRFFSLLPRPSLKPHRHTTAKPLQASLTNALSKPSISAGLGIVYRLEPVRVEMNFGVPLVTSRGEGARKGFQLGIGLEFL